MRVIRFWFANPASQDNTPRGAEWRRAHKSWVDRRKKLWWAMDRARGQEVEGDEGERTFLAAMEERLGSTSLAMFTTQLPDVPSSWRALLGP